METFSENDIRQLVKYAQSAPEYLTFYKACFCIATLADMLPEQVIAICRPAGDFSPEIVEALRIPTYATTNVNKGQVIIF
jgi:hypothetical protein